MGAMIAAAPVGGVLGWHGKKGWRLGARLAKHASASIPGPTTQASAWGICGGPCLLGGGWVDLALLGARRGRGSLIGIGKAAT